MNEPINDGGPAFPMPMTEGTSSCSPYGISKRDYFAAAALNAIISNRAMIDCFPTPHAEGLAKEAFACADAMLKQRERL